MLDINYANYVNMAAVVARANGLSNITNVSQMTLDETVNYGGYRTLKNTYTPTGTEHGGQIIWYISPYPASPATPVTSSWWRCWRRYSPAFTTQGLGSGAASLKVFGLLWTSYDQRLALEITSGTAYQLYMSAITGLGVTYMPFVNSADPAQGSQSWQVSTEWTSGLWWQYVIQTMYVGNELRARVWGFPDGTIPSAYRLRVTGTASGAPPTVNGCDTMFYYNRTPTGALMSINEAGVEASTDANPWNMPDPMT